MTSLIRSWHQKAKQGRKDEGEEERDCEGGWWLEEWPEAKTGEFPPDTWQDMMSLCYIQDPDNDGHSAEPDASADEGEPNYSGQLEDCPAKKKKKSRGRPVLSLLDQITR